MSILSQWLDLMWKLTIYLHGHQSTMPSHYILSLSFPFFLILSFLSRYSILSQPIPFYFNPTTNLLDTFGLGSEKNPSCTDIFLSDNMNFRHTLESKFLRTIITGFNCSIVCLQWAPKTHTSTRHKLELSYLSSTVVKKTPLPEVKLNVKHYLNKFHRILFDNRLYRHIHNYHLGSYNLKT